MSSLSAEFIHNLIKFALLPRLARASRGHTLTTPPPPFPHPTPSPIQDTAHLYSRVRCHHRLCSASAAPDAWLTSHRFSRRRQCVTGHNELVQCITCGSWLRRWHLPDHWCGRKHRICSDRCRLRELRQRQCEEQERERERY